MPRACAFQRSLVVSYWNGLSIVFPILLFRNIREYDDRFLALCSDIGFPYWSTDLSSGRVGEKQQGCGSRWRLSAQTAIRALIEDAHGPQWLVGQNLMCLWWLD